MVCKQRDGSWCTLIVGGGVEVTATREEGTPSAEPVVYSGMHVGEAAFPEIPVNAVRLTVLEDGRVDGELSCDARERITGQDCGSDGGFSAHGTFSGSLTAETGVIPTASTMETRWTPFRLGEVPCGDPGPSSGSYVRTVQVRVEGEHMHGDGTAADEEGGTGTFQFDACRE